MIKSVTITNYLGSLDEHVQRSLGITSYDYNNSTIHVRLNEPDPVHGFIIKKIEGMGPPKADINMTDLATADGSIFNSARLGTRNLVLTIGFDNCDDAEEARYRTYKYLPIKRKVMVSIETESRNARVIGYVESNEPDVFSKAVQCTISIVCPDPYFYSNEYGFSPHVIQFTGLDSEFEWPFDNNSLTEDLTSFGAMKQVTDKDFLYEGDQETGVKMIMAILGDIDTNVKIVHKKNSYNTNEALLTSEFVLDNSKLNDLLDSLDLAPNLLTGDEINIDTTNGNKKIILTRNTHEYNILNAVTRDSDWFQLAKGLNRFAFTTYGFNQNLEFRVENYVIYEGV